jgi:hypothetical protein
MVPGFLFCMAPGPYREDALPSWESRTRFRGKKDEFKVDENPGRL